MIKKYNFFKDNIGTNNCSFNISDNGKKVYFCQFKLYNCKMCEVKEDCDKLFGKNVPAIELEYIDKLKLELPELFI